MKCALHAAFVQILFFKSCGANGLERVDFADERSQELPWSSMNGKLLTYISIFQKKSRDIGRSIFMMIV